MTAEFLQIEPPYEAAPRFHSASPRAFPSCHPERSEAKSNCKAASNKVQTGSPTEKFDKLRMTRSDKKQHPPKWVLWFSKMIRRNKNLSLRVLAIPFDIVHFSCDIVRYREHREYRRIKCCTKFAPKSHQHSTLFCSTNWNLSFYKFNLDFTCK